MMTLWRRKRSGRGTSTGTVPLNAAVAFAIDATEPWNSAAPGGTHTDDGTMTPYFWANCSNSAGNINMLASYALYSSADATTTYTVTCSIGALNGQTIPFNPAWNVYHPDKQMIIVDASVAGYTWEMFNVSAINAVAKTITCTRGERLNVDDRTAYTTHGGNYNSRGIGIAYMSMLITEAEIVAGVIPHALSMRVHATRYGEAWWPATKVENKVDAEFGGAVTGGNPEGARWKCAFNAGTKSAWIASATAVSVDFGRFATALATALETYGFFVTDYGGATAGVDFQHPSSWSSSHATFAGWLNTNSSTVRDMLDGLLSQAALILCPEQGSRI